MANKIILFELDDRELQMIEELTLPGVIDWMIAGGKYEEYDGILQEITTTEEGWRAEGYFG